LLEIADFCAWSDTELTGIIAIRKKITEHLLGLSKRNLKTPSGEHSKLKYETHYKKVPEGAAINL